MHPRCSVRALAAALPLLTISALTPAGAQVQTLTDQQGRVLKAQVLAVDDGKVKIKREDGQTFELPLATLSGETQKSLKVWAEKAASEIPAGAVTV
jgi:hypothetical protein